MAPLPLAKAAPQLGWIVWPDKQERVGNARLRTGSVIRHRPRLAQEATSMISLIGGRDWGTIPNLGTTPVQAIRVRNMRPEIRGRFAGKLPKQPVKVGQ